VEIMLQGANEKVVVTDTDCETLWAELCFKLGHVSTSLAVMKETYNTMTQFLSVAYVIKEALIDILRKHELDQNDASTFLAEVRQLVVMGLAQGEREKHGLLKMSMDIRRTRATLIKLEGRLEACRRFESILKSRLEIVKMELQLSGRGHE